MYNFSILRDLKKCYSKLTVVIKGKKTATKTSNKFKIVPRIGTLLVLALQNFARVVSFLS